MARAKTTKTVNGNATVTAKKRASGKKQSTTGTSVKPTSSAGGSKPIQSPRAIASEATTAPAAGEGGGSKQASIIAMLRRPDGVTVAELMQRTGWLSHSVRGVLSAVVKRKLGLIMDSSVEPDRGRVYRIVTPKSAPSAETSTSAARRANARRGKLRAGVVGAAA